MEDTILHWGISWGYIGIMAKKMGTPLMRIHDGFAARKQAGERKQTGFLAGLANRLSEAKASKRPQARLTREHLETGPHLI